MRISTALILLSAVLMGCGSSASPRRTYRDVTAGGVAGAAPIGPSAGYGPRGSYDGVAGGPIEAASWDGSCRGWIPVSPQIQFDVPAPSVLVVSATSPVDTTMVVVFPDGHMACNDDTNGLNPQVSGEFTPGHYRVFIGTYREGNSGTFHAEVSPAS